ncbi:MAG: PAS domain S-box protein [Armatimonadota bacterium]
MSETLAPAAASAHSLLNVIDFLCLAAGIYLLLVLHDRRQRAGLLLIAFGLGVLALRLAPTQLFLAAPGIRTAADTLAYAAAGLLISWGVLALVRDGSLRSDHPPLRQALLVIAATIAILSTVVVWALPFHGPLQEFVRSAESAFVTFEHGLRVAVAGALFACAWILWERRGLGDSCSRMFGAAFFCWAVAAVLEVTDLLPLGATSWTARIVRVLGSLFIGNALVVHVYEGERAARERRERLALLDRVTSTALEAPRLQTVTRAATDEVRALLDALLAVVYLVEDSTGSLTRCYSSGNPVDLPEHLAVEDDHPIARSVANVAPERLELPVEGKLDETCAGVSVPLSGLTEAVGALMVLMPRDRRMSDADIEALTTVGSQLGMIVQHMMLLEQVRHSGDRWRQTFDSINEMVTVHDRDGKIVAANMSALNFADMTASEVKGATLGRMLGSCPEQEEMLRECIATGRPPKSATQRIRGRVHRVQVTPLRDDEGQTSGCVRVARDVTSRWLTEQRLEQSEERYRDLAENANDIIYTHDLDGKFLYVNQAGARILGYGQQELLRLRFWDLVAPESEPKARSYVQGLLHGELQDEQIQLHMSCADGRVAVVQLRANVLRRSDQREIVHGIARDVTTETELTTQLMQAERLASVGTLLAGIAHELNNPLTSISGYAELLAMQLEDSPHSQAVARLGKEAARCRTMAKNLLNFARQTDERPARFPLNGLVRGVLDLRAYDLRAADIHVETSLQEDMPPVVADHGQIQQVVYNLVDNAYYAVQQQGGGGIRAETWAEDDMVCLSVTDTGPGLAEDVIDRVFEPFFTTKPRGEGTGLGLSICRRIAEAHGGSITAANVEDGARFTLRLPIAQVEIEESAEKPSDDLAVDELSTGRVLFIDDEPSLCALVADYLMRLGHDVEVVSTGEEGLEKALDDSFDVIICDMRLPGISGEEVCTQLLEHIPDAKKRIMVATGDILSPKTQAFFDRTGLPHIHKPFRLDELGDAVARLLAGRPLDHNH